MKAWSAYSKGGKTGILGGILGVLASGVILFAPLTWSSTTLSDGGTTSGWAPAAIGYLFGTPGADPVLFFWGVVVLALALLGGVAAVTARRRAVLGVSVLLLCLTVLGLLSIGLFVAPAAVAFLLSGLWLGTSNEPAPASDHPPQ